MTEIRSIVTRQVVVDSPDRQPSNEKLGGSKFLEGNPQGREVNPQMTKKGHKDVRIAG